MKYKQVLLILVLLAALPLSAQEVRLTGEIHTETGVDLSPQTLLSLAADHRDDDGIVWFGYVIPVRPQYQGLTGRNEIQGRHFRGTVNERYAIPADDDGIIVGASAEKLLLYKVALNGTAAQIADVRLYSLDTELEFSRPMVHIASVSAAESLELAEQLWQRADDELRHELALVLAVHPQERALDLLETAIAHDTDADVRQSALQWYGFACRGADAERLLALFDSLKEDELRRDAVYHLYNLDLHQKLLQIAEEDASEDVRQQAYFWLGIAAGNRLVESMGDEAGISSEEQSKVFELYQLDTTESRELLKRVALQGRTGAVRKQALFWLVQRPDSQTLTLLKELLQE